MNSVAQDHVPINREWQVIDRVWDLTKAIEAASTTRDWPETARLVAERSPLLMSLTEPQSEVARNILRAIYEADQTVMREAQAAQTELQQAYHAAANSLRNAGQYQRVAQF